MYLKLCGMDADERDICAYLKSWRGQFVSPREVCRRAGGKSRFRKEPDWAVPVFVRLLEKGVVECDSTGYYRLRPRPKSDRRNRRWMSPEIKRILEASGKEFDGVFHVEEDPDTPDE